MKKLKRIVTEDIYGNKQERIIVASVEKIITYRCSNCLKYQSKDEKECERCESVMRHEEVKKRCLRCGLFFKSELNVCPHFHYRR